MSNSLNEIKAHVQAGRFEEAAECFKRVDDSSLPMEAKIIYALSLTRLGKAAEALALLDSLHESARSSPKARFLYADNYRAIGQFALAANAVEPLLTTELASAELTYFAADTYMSGGFAVEALALIQAYGARESDTASSMAKLSILEGRALAAVEREDEARHILEGIGTGDTALASAAKYRLARLALLEGDFDSALACSDTFHKENPEAFAAQNLRLTSLIQCGRTEDAAEYALGLPENSDPQLIATAADYLSEMGYSDPLNSLLRSWQSRPSETLAKQLLPRLLATSKIEEAESMIAELRGSKEMAHVAEWAHISLLANLGDHNQVIDVITRSPHRHQFDEQMALACFAIGDYETALEVSMRVLERDTSDQYAIALAATALRCRLDPRGLELYDVDNLIIRYQLDSELLALDTSISEVAEEVRKAHSTLYSPTFQSITGGSQTPGHLLRQHTQPSIKALKKVITQRCERHFDDVLSKVDKNHPHYQAMPKKGFLQTSWSINAKSGGHHMAHVHPKGWLSGVAYLDLPSAMSQGTEGLIEFGAPPFEIKDPLPVMKQIAPQQGELLLFPSYLWHRTTPFTGEGERLIVAFDYGTPCCFV
jgi:uncharacterized protein (TIGR02466 family)